MINIPELVPELLLPPTELTGAGALLELVQPASHSETSDSAATRRTVNLGLPVLIYPPKMYLLVRVENRGVI